MIREAIQTVVSGQSLSMQDAAAVMEEIMDGTVTPAQFGAFVTSLRMKGETVEEIAGLASVMKRKAAQVKVTGPAIDIVGTGGDKFNSFNMSTAAAIITAAAGMKVAKHGNRAMSSKCGSADVLEALGVKLELTAQQAASCLQKAGICFMFAPVFHPAMRYAVAPRREIGIRTVFNILGPLTNPAGAGIYLIGVAAESLLEKMALVLQRLDCRNAMIVHSTDGLDEITLSGNTRVCELKNGHISSYIIGPADFGLTYNCSLEDLRGGTVEENAMLLRSILNGQEGPYLDAALMNAAAALFVGQKVSSLKQGFNLAQRVIDNGQALATLQLLIDTSHSVG